MLTQKQDKCFRSLQLQYLLTLARSLGFLWGIWSSLGIRSGHMTEHARGVRHFNTTLINIGYITYKQLPTLLFV